jgi:two-component system, chemotaxis family, protein-glutamate methylesterase/glutaminase
MERALPVKTDERPDVVVIGASAGGVRALQKVVSALPVDLEAAVFVVLHIWAEADSALPEILSRAGRMPAMHPKDGEPFEMGRIYVAPPDRHIFLQDGELRVPRGPKENRHRPAIDVLFRSAATAYGPRVIGALLTGSDDDGAAGLQSIQERGGTVIVQDPADSAFPDMPESALRVVQPDFTLSLNEIGPAVRDLVSGAVKPNPRLPMPEPVDKSYGQEQGIEVDVQQLGTPTAFSCPDCNGTLWELVDGDLLRYRCRVGHAYSAASMIDAEADAVDRALWEALRVLEESVSISRRIAAKNDTLRTQLTRKAEEREHHAKVLRNLLVNGK